MVFFSFDPTMWPMASGRMGRNALTLMVKRLSRELLGKLSKEFSRELSGELSVQLSLEFTFGIDVSVGSSICVYASTGSNTVYNPNNAGRQPRPSILKTPAIRNSGWRCAKKNEPKELCDFAEEAGRTSSFGDHSQVFASELDGKKQIPLSAYDF